MNDRAGNLLEKYDIELLRIRKGRGMLLCDSTRGTLCFKEYFGQEKRLELIQEMMNRASQSGIGTQELIKTREGEWLVQDGDGINYILKTYPEGRELNVSSEKELIQAVGLLARLHRCMVLETPVSTLPPFSLVEEFQKRNREMKSARNFIRKKGSKQPFERALLQVIEKYIEKAEEVTEGYQRFEQGLSVKENLALCHGDYQYHHLVYRDDRLYLLNFEKLVLDHQVRDLYFFLRKILEKSNWGMRLGETMLSSYDKERTLTREDLQDLYYRFAYPEKFWKIVNFYMNSKKSWIPVKNLEKLTRLVSQEEEKEIFLQRLLQ